MELPVLDVLPMLKHLAAIGAAFVLALPEGLITGIGFARRTQPGAEGADASISPRAETGRARD